MPILHRKQPNGCWTFFAIADCCVSARSRKEGQLYDITLHFLASLPTDAFLVPIPDQRQVQYCSPVAWESCGRNK